MRVAIVHYWLVGMWGGDKVVEALLDLYPEADIYCHVWRPDELSDKVRDRVKSTTFIDRLPGGRKHYQKYLPFMPLALEQLDLTAYDLVISSESGPAKGVITRPDSLHLCYCHSPMRYAWNLYPQYIPQVNWLLRPLARLIMHYVRIWDRAAADRVDRFVANSRTVEHRINKYYRRKARVIHPPVDIERFQPTADHDDYFLFVSRLVAYKRADIAVEAFNRLGRRLLVVGGGAQEEELRRVAKPNVEFLGKVPDERLAELMHRCRALVFMAEEDFGIVPVEAMAAGKPVIAYGRGGATETVLDGRTGVLFPDQTVEALIAAVARAETLTFDAQAIADHAAGFAKHRFLEEMRAEIDRSLDAFRRFGPLGPDR